MIKSHERAPAHEKVAFIKLKWMIYDKFVLLRGFSESDFEHLYNQTSKYKVRGAPVKKMKMFLHEAHCMNLKGKSLFLEKMCIYIVGPTDTQVSTNI